MKNSFLVLKTTTKRYLFAIFSPYVIPEGKMDVGKDQRSYIAHILIILLNYKSIHLNFFQQKFMKTCPV